MVTPVEIASGAAAAQTGFKYILGLVKTLKDIDDRIKRNALLFEIQEKLVEQQSAYLDEIEKRKAAVERADALEEKLLEREDFDRVAQLYKLFSPCLGVLVYVPRDPPEDGGKVQWLCPHCFENKELHLLQATEQVDGRRLGRLDLGFKCPECGFAFAVLRSAALRLLAR